MDESLRVCILSKQFPPGVGGAETYAYELAKGLAERGHEVDVYTQWIDDPHEQVDTPNNVTVHRVCKARKKLVTFETLYFSYKVRRRVNLEEYDVIHGTLMPASTVAVTLFNHVSTPLFLTSHGTSMGETKAVALETPADYLLKFFFHPMNVIMDRISTQSADTVIAISDHAYDQLITYYGIDEENIKMIPHGVDTSWFYPRDERHPAVDPEKLTLLYVGRIGARKGLGLALRALAEVENDEVEFLIAGTGRHEDRLQKLACDLGINNQIQFLGYVPDDELPILYSSADAFILPSRYEGFGLVLLEAMACGTPVIGSDTGGIPTVIDHGTNGIIVNRSIEDFSKAIGIIISDSKLREKYAKNAYHKAQSTSWTEVVKQVEKTYD